MNSSEIILTESAYQNQRLSGFNRGSWLEFWRKLNFPPRHPIIKTAKSNITARLLYRLFSICHLWDTNKDISGCGYNMWNYLMSCIIIIIRTSPLLAQWAWTPCPCPSRRWPRCWSGRRGGWPGIARAEESHAELDLNKLLLSLERERKLHRKKEVGPAKNCCTKKKTVIGLGNMKQESYLEKQEVQTGPQVHLVPNWRPAIIWNLKHEVFKI